MFVIYDNYDIHIYIGYVRRAYVSYLSDIIFIEK